MIILIPKVDEEGADMVYPYLSFCYKMQYLTREGTGYKELSGLGLDPAGLRSLDILGDPTSSGAYRFIEENIPNLVKIYSIGKPKPFYISDTLWGASNEEITNELLKLISDSPKESSL